jgi:molybdopterin/thiamine biosynthesis adenylyltransferase
MLTDDQVERYSRQILLPGIGGRGQERLLAARVALVGVTLAADAAALYLAAAGVGHLVLVGNGATAALAGLSAINPDAHIVSASLAPRHVREVLDGTDLVLSGDLDRHIGELLNAACLRAQRPLVWGRVDAGRGHVSMLCGAGGTAPCLACLTPPDGPPPGNSPARDVFTDLAAAFVGTQQALEAIRFLVGLPPTLAGRLLTYAARDGTVATTRVERDPACAACRGVPASARRTEA